MTRDETVLGLVTHAGQKPRVAIVGGSPASIMVATVLVEQFGCEPVAAPSGEAVLTLLHHNEPVDLVMIDMPVPDMDSIVAVQLIRALGARGALPVLALTDDAEGLAMGHEGAAGVSATVVKPYSPRELYGAMQAALSRAPVAVSGLA